MTAYYNENDPKAAAWLRELIFWGLIADGEVDTRSIEDVTPNDLRGFTQCHFFAGIGGWSYALRLAGWSDGRPAWTGSCPCQPFSAAGKSGGFADERHLWPAFFHLIVQCQPAVVFGEQVASPHGLAWLDLVQTDLEGEGYATGAADLCAAGIGAPHIRQRLYWVGHTGGGGGGRDGGTLLRAQGGAGREVRSQPNIAELTSQPSGLADPERAERRSLGIDSENGRGRTNSGRQEAHGVTGARGEVRSTAGTVGDTYNAGSQGWSQRRNRTDKWPTWAASLVDCRDGKRRPVEPGTFPLAHGVSGRVGLLRGYGNAIVPQVAVEFIGAYLDAI